MKKTLYRTAIALILIVACAGCRTPATKATASDLSWEDRAVYAGGLIPAARSVLDELPGATVYHMDVTVSDSLDRLEGGQRVHYTNREGVPLEEVIFRTYPNVTGGKLALSSVTVDGKTVQPAFEYTRSAARVPLPEPLAPGETTVVEMDYEVTLPTEMGGNYGLFGYFEDVLVLDTFYPTVAVYDDGWHVGNPPHNGDLTHYDASFYVVRFTAPQDLTVIASGVEVGREREGAQQTLTYAAGPARDFYIAASDNYVEVSDKVGGTTVHSYALPEHVEHAKLALDFAIDALESFGERFGTYPYTELDVASTPMLALGMEYPGVIAIALREYDPGYDFDGTPSRVYLESTIAHEVGHQWFYNAVGNDQVDEPWVDEAVVQYLTWLYYVDTYGEGPAEGYRSSWMGRWERVDGADIPIGLPSDAYEGREYGAIVYGRGPLFVTALAEEMGQETFDAFLRDYYQDHTWEIGTGQSFRETAEEHCACDLGPLFEEWVYP